MNSLVNKKVRGQYRGRSVQEGMLVLEKGVWCFFSNCPYMSDNFTTEFPDRRGYKYVWLFGTSDGRSEADVISRFNELVPIRKMNHEQE